MPETSTNVLFGATFNTCTFRNQAARAGLQRRFLYYVADGHGRLIVKPKDQHGGGLERLIREFSLLERLSGEIRFQPKTDELWDEFQRQNRHEYNKSDPLNESVLSRLSSAPIQALKVALIFEACRTVMNEMDLVELRPDMLELAIQHVEECLQAACFLDSIANRVFIAGDAEMLLEKIRVDFASLAKNGSIILTRSELTARYCHHRNRGIPVAELYQRLIPTLIDQGNAKILSKNGRQERYAFRTQSVE